MCTFCTQGKMERNVDRSNLLPLASVYQCIRHLIWKIARIVLVPLPNLHIGVVKALLCSRSLIVTTCPRAVPIIPLSGISLPDFASRHVAEWFHIRTEKLYYQSQLFTLQMVSRFVYIKRAFFTTVFCRENPPFLLPQRCLNYCLKWVLLNHES
jgi:hypothetical protein